MRPREWQMGQPNVLIGTVKNGVIVPQTGVHLPEGSSVKFIIQPFEFTREEQAEFEGWELLGDEAWALIDEWEKEDSHRATG